MVTCVGGGHELPCATHKQLPLKLAWTTSHMPKLPPVRRACSACSQRCLRKRQLLWARDASGDVLLEMLLEGLLETHSWKEALHAKGIALPEGLWPVSGVRTPQRGSRPVKDLFCSRGTSLSSCHPWVTQAGAETLRNSVTWKLEEAKSWREKWVKC